MIKWSKYLIAMALLGMSGLVLASIFIKGDVGGREMLETLLMILLALVPAGGALVFLYSAWLDRLDERDDSEDCDLSTGATDTGPN